LDGEGVGKLGVAGAEHLADLWWGGAEGGKGRGFHGTDCDKEQRFPEKMPFYFRHTSRFNREHARALMRVRCCSDPFAASPFLKWSAVPTCPPCPGAVPETAEHVLLDCPAYAHLRANPRHMCLFQLTHPPPQPAERLRVFTSRQPQTRLASFVHSCIEYHAQPL
jgi:hypothetical protein